MRPLSTLIALSLLAFPTASLVAQDLGSLLNDPKFPQKIQPTDLGDDMRAMKITYEKQGGGDLFSMMMNPMMMLMGAFGSMGGSSEPKPADPEQAAAMMFFDKLGISWTNGKTIKLYDQEFLITYTPQINLIEASKSKSPPDLSKEPLTLTLINTKSIAAITPRMDMTKAEWMRPAPTPPPGELMERAKNSSLSNLKQVGLAMMIYATDYDDVFPYAQSTKGAFEVLLPYAKSVEMFQSLNPNSPEFRLNMSLAGVSQTDIEEPQAFPMFYEAEAWPDGQRAVVFADSSARFVGAGEWEAMKPKLSVKLKKNGKPLPASLGSTWPRIGGAPPPP